MKTANQPEMLFLSDHNIDLSSGEIDRFLASADVERREALRVRLTLEEVLLKYREKFGEEAAYSIKCTKRFPTVKIELIVPGESFDPFGKAEEADEVIHGLLAGIGVAPAWNYRRGRNYVVFMPKRKPLSDTVKMLLAIVLAAAAGGVLSLMPGPVSQGVNAYLLTPVTNAFMGLITAISGPLVFLSILRSICSMGNIETLGKIGSKTIKAIFLYITVITVFMTGFGLLFYPMAKGGGGASDFSQVLDLIYGIFPSNLFEPFISGNALQVIFIAIMVGLSMLVLSSKVSGVFGLVEQFTAITQTIMAGLSSMLPILIFTLFTGMISGGNLGTILSSGKMIGVIVLLMLIYQAANIIRVAIVKKVPPALLFKKSLPTAMICLTTASSAAAFSTNTQDAHAKLGIDRKLVEFGTPLGQVLFRPGYIALLFGMEAGFAQACGIPITLPWVIIGIISNILISCAMPPVPGGAMVGITIAFTQLGIPMEMIGIALAVAAIIDFPATAANVSGWQITLIDVADSLGMLDREVLTGEEKGSPKRC